MSSLQGKVALVTGSARGIGAVIAVALAQQGADVIVNYVSESSKILAEEVAKNVESHGSKTLVIQANLASVEDLDSLVKQSVARFGKIDILVNNGAIVEFQPIGAITKESFAKQFDVNVRAVVLLSQAVVPYMSNGGRIINISSIAARQGHPGMTTYGATKAALESVTRVFGIELRDKGIRVNSVNPGPIETEKWIGLPDEVLARNRSLGPVGKPEDIADVVTFLAGPQSRWITGTTIGTNNGVVLN